MTLRGIAELIGYTSPSASHNRWTRNKSVRNEKPEKNTPHSESNSPSWLQQRLLGQSDALYCFMTYMFEGEYISWGIAFPFISIRAKGNCR